MHVISRKALVLFAMTHVDAADPLDNWYRLTRKADWTSLRDVKLVFRRADIIGHCTVFNVGGNKYRLVTKIKYPKKTVYIRSMLTHAEYDKGGWRYDCFAKARLAEVRKTSSKGVARRDRNRRGK